MEKEKYPHEAHACGSVMMMFKIEAPVCSQSKPPFVTKFISRPLTVTQLMLACLSTRSSLARARARAVERENERTRQRDSETDTK